MRLVRSTLILTCVSALALAASCGDDVTLGSTGGGSESGGTASTDTSAGETSASGSETSAGCPVGSEGCPCTPGGFCDGDLVCEDMSCVPPAGDGDGDPATGDGDGDPSGDGDGDATGDGDGDPMPSWDEMYPSCEDLADDACGGDNCCATDDVPGGWFAMGRGGPVPCAGMPAEGQDCAQSYATCQTLDATWGCPQGEWVELGGLDDGNGQDADEQPEHAARVGFYGLDRYEVTVSRMRAFLDAYDKDALLALLDGGAGEHPDVAGSGWQEGWDFRLPDTAQELSDSLMCDGSATWTANPGANEDYPITCASWYLAYAFCAWDEGRLPTEAEWERAAIGGDENRLYPWGEDTPSDELANYLSTDNSTNVEVYAKPDGAGRYGQEGLAGSAWEWVLDYHDPDWYGGDGLDCQDCANVDGEGARVMRGGDWQYTATQLRGAERFPGTSGAYWLGSGIRCARD